MRVFLHDNYGISKRRYQELYAFCQGNMGKGAGFAGML